MTSFSIGSSFQYHQHHPQTKRSIPFYLLHKFHRTNQFNVYDFKQSQLIARCVGDKNDQQSLNDDINEDSENNPNIENVNEESENNPNINDDTSDKFENNPNIEDLAKILSQEAQKMRESIDEDDKSIQFDDNDAELDQAQEELEEISRVNNGDGLNSGQDYRTPRSFGYMSPEEEKEILAQVGEGGFVPEQFQIFNNLGQLMIQYTEELNIGEQVLGTSRINGPKRPVVVAFLATYLSGLPYQGPLTMLLKEYLPEAKSLGCNELSIMTYLVELPEQKWQVGSKDPSNDIPIFRVLGYFTALSSEEAVTLSYDEENPEEALWLVFKFENLKPVTLYPTTEQYREPIKLFWQNKQDLVREARWRMLRQISYLSVRALEYCHSRGVVHGSMSSGSLLLSTFCDVDADRLVLKLDNFGFGKRYDLKQQEIMTKLSIQDSPFLLGCQQDRQALGFVLMEMYFSALVSEEEYNRGATTQSALQRLLFDVFGSSMDDFRQYCHADPALSQVVQFLDQLEGAGWKLLEKLILAKNANLKELMQISFLNIKLDTKMQK